MQTTALLTGKGNNTLRDKNILEVCGKPLLAYPAEAARKSSLIDEFFVSRDDDKLLSIAQDCGFKRIKRKKDVEN